MKKALLHSFIIITIIFSKTSAQPCVADKPAGLFVTDIKACQVTLHWKHVPNVAYYHVRYRMKGVNVWTSVNAHVHDTLYTLTGLQSSTLYNLEVSSVCPSSKGKYAITKAMTASCEVPQVTGVQVSDNQSVYITWETYCSTASNQLRFRKKGTVSWNYVLTGTNQFAELSSLSLNTTYTFQVAACTDTANHWSVIDSFKIPPLPNILVIVLDDARYDSYSSNGGPSFFQSVNIDRIANEGVNFKNSFVTYALCAPSRATMFTGLYPHNNGAYNNDTPYHTDLPTVSTILHDKGYYTALLGKFLMPTTEPTTPQPGWDFWMATDKWAKIDPRYNRNGTEIFPKGHEMDILTDTAIHLFATKANEQPMLMFLCYLSPHMALIPKAEDVGAFAGDIMPFPTNYFLYSDNYPSFFNTLTNSEYKDSNNLENDLEAYFEVILGLDKDIGRLLDTMESMNKLDNTLVLFMSDNGYFFGEHTLKGKKLSYEPAIRVPLYVRYPKWFAPASVNTSQLVTNLDVAPTLLAAAGVSNTYGMQGFSLKDLYNETKQRDAFYIEQIQPKPEIDEYPDFRSVRTRQYKYTYYFCTDTAEEFFDLVNDPKENTNLINDAAYQSLIAQYRVKLDSFKVLLQDTVSPGYYPCSLIVNEREGSDEEIATSGILMYPNPASNKVIISMNDVDGPLNVALYATNGQLMLKENLDDKKQQLLLDVQDLAEGLYLVAFKYEHQVEFRKLLVIH